MSPARRSRPGRAPGFKPATAWSALTPAAGQGVTTLTKVLLGSFVATEQVTVRRTHGLVEWRSDQKAADESPFGAYGLCIVSNNAFAAGIASIPGPYTDADSDLWFVHQFLRTTLLFGSNIGFDGQAGASYTINSKAMRKLTDEETIAVVVENGSTTAGATMFHALRILSSGSRG